MRHLFLKAARMPLSAGRLFDQSRASRSRKQDYFQKSAKRDIAIRRRSRAKTDQHPVNGAQPMDYPDDQVSDKNASLSIGETAGYRRIYEIIRTAVIRHFRRAAGDEAGDLLDARALFGAISTGALFNRTSR